MTEKQQKRKAALKMQKREIDRELEFDKILEKQKKSSRIHKNRQNPEWKKLKITINGKIFLRCQGKKLSGKQCLNTALQGSLLCKSHSGNYKSKPSENKKSIEIRKSLGIYEGEGLALQAEIKELEHITPDQMEDTTGEIKLSLALLRSYLKNTEDSKIAKNPGQLMYLLGEIARLKKEYHEIKHSKDVSFTREQMMYLFNRFYLILIKKVKDTDLLEQIGNEIESVGKSIGENGFIEIN